MSQLSSSKSNFWPKRFPAPESWIIAKSICVWGGTCCWFYFRRWSARSALLRDHVFEVQMIAGGLLLLALLVQFAEEGDLGALERPLVAVGIHKCLGLVGHAGTIFLEHMELAGVRSEEHVTRELFQRVECTGVVLHDLGIVGIVEQRDAFIEVRQVGDEHVISAAVLGDVQ